MKKDINQDLIDEIINLSSQSNDELNSKITQLIEIYKKQQIESLQTKKQNQYFIKQWDKRNILTKEQDLKQDKVQEQQSYLISMGEIIDAITHQIKKPLNSFRIMSDSLKKDFSNGVINQEYIDNLDSTVNLQIDSIIDTLNEFRTFFYLSNSNETFFIQDFIDSIQELLKDELLSQNILLDLEIDKTIKIDANKDELKHLFTNLIQNSIDAFNEKNIQTRKIFIRCYKEKNNIYLELEDSAGGIDKRLLKDIFKPNITTKKNAKVTGVGLYMSSQIVQKNKGTINVHNSNLGAFFTITLPQTTKL